MMMTMMMMMMMMMLMNSCEPGSLSSLGLRPLCPADATGAKAQGLGPYVYLQARLMHALWPAPADRVH
eukprot:5457-Karenia_brevis.AAC.1